MPDSKAWARVLTTRRDATAGTVGALESAFSPAIPFRVFASMSYMLSPFDRRKGVRFVVLAHT